MSERYPPIGDHALLGDCRCAALVTGAGTVDWLCLPRFDSPAVFSSLLDAERGGSFAVRPAGHVTTSRRYLPGTNLLETTFRAEGGVLRLTDLLAVAEEDGGPRMRPRRELLRRVECLEGEVEVEVACDPRPDYGLGRARVEDRRGLGLWFDLGRQALALQSEIPLGVAGCGAAGRERLRAGERRYLSLSADDAGPAIVPPLAGAEARLEESRRFWAGWSGRLRYQGPWREEVLRSILALKLLTYAPSGAVVAAPTTSLPEAIGGERNWDYRYCWLRDASWTLDSFLDLGCREEGMAFLSWLLHNTRLRRPELQVLYDLHGEVRTIERELPLEGYRGSRPVRVGNAAAGQLQLDVYGEVIEAAAELVDRGGELQAVQASLLAGLGKTVCRLWRQPDEGIWEKRSGRAHHTFSKMMCWVALDRLLRLAGRGDLGRRRLPHARFAREREAIRRAIESEGWHPGLASYVDVLGGHAMDASLLLLGIYGYVEPASARFRSTLDRVLGELGRGGPLLGRYPTGRDGLPPGEGAFAICGFWAVEALARAGALDEAAGRFEALLAHANDVGLYAEEIDPATGAALGNFPQAFSHVGLINAALALAEQMGIETAPEGVAAGVPETRM